MNRQQTPETEWEISRMGKLTGSEIHRLLTKPKSGNASGLSEGAKTYCKEKICQLLTGTTRSFTNFAMEWGKEQEYNAIERLRKDFYPDIIHYGAHNPRFIQLNRFSGSSPDAEDLKSRIAIEIKCPENPEIHLDYILIKTAEDLKKHHLDHYSQIQMHIMCLNEANKVNDYSGLFISYCPHFIPVNQKDPDKFSLKLLAVTSDVEHQELIRTKIELGCKYMGELLDEIERVNKNQ